MTERPSQDVLDRWFAAAREGRRHQVRKLLAQVDPNVLTPAGWNALMTTVYNGHGTTMDLLLPGSDLRQATDRGLTVLHLAVGHLGHGLVPRLLAQGADPCATTRVGQSPLHLACDHGVKLTTDAARAEFQALLAVSDPSQVDQEGTTALMVAAGNGDAFRVQALLPRSPVNAKSRTGWTALMAAAMYGDTERVSLLLDAGADATLCNEEGINAAQAGLQGVIRPEALQRLLACSSVQTPSSDGTSALMWAAGRKDLRLMQLVLDQMDPNGVDEDGWSALVFALNQDCPPQARHLAGVMTLESLRNSLDLAHTLDLPVAADLIHELRQVLVSREQQALRAGLPLETSGTVVRRERERL